MSLQLILEPGAVRLSTWRKVQNHEAEIRLAEGTARLVNACRDFVARKIETNEPVYAVNTGFGKLASVRIDTDRLVELQENLIMSHAAGTGPLLGDDIVRMTMVLKACALGQAHSGVRWQVIESLLALVNSGVYPCIPAKGSVGASGDLAPLAHMVTAMMGKGGMRHQGEMISAARGLEIARLKPLVLGPKEGVALINGTQVSTALALKGLFLAEDLLRSAVVTGAMTVDACRGSATPFDALIHRLRRQTGQNAVAAVYRRLLDDSEIRESHKDCGKVQDPYSLRCQPQVMGACLDQLNFAAEVLEREGNSVTDNPLVFPEDGDVLSGGNFHAEPVSMAADNIALALAEIGSMSERRQAMLVDAGMSGLPAFLAAEGGLNSGFMIGQVTSAALVSENKALAHPSSVDSIPTSANQEDHVSMSTYAARRLLDMADNVFAIVAIEWLAAAEGLDFHAPLTTSKPLRKALQILRAEVSGFEKDRFFAPEIENAKQLLMRGALTDLVEEPLGPGYSQAPN